MSSRLVDPDPGARRLAERSAATTRRSASTSPTAGRCAACTPGWRPTPAALLGEPCAGPPPHAVLEPYASIDELLADLAVVDRLAAHHGAGPLADGARRAGAPRRWLLRLPPLRARPAPERRRARAGRRRPARVAGATDDYARARRSTSGSSVLRRRARRPAPAAHARGRRTASRTSAELAILDAAADGGAPLRRRRRAPLRHLQVRVGQRRARGGGAGRGRAPRPGRAPTTIDIVPLFETIDDLQRAGAGDGRAVRRLPIVPRARRRPRPARRR